jgi:signal transduction histidine kinase
MNTPTQQKSLQIPAHFPELIIHRRHGLGVETLPHPSDRQPDQAPVTKAIKPSARIAAGYRARVDMGGVIEETLAPFAEKPEAPAESGPSVFSKGEVLMRAPTELGPVLRLAAWIVGPLAELKGVELRLDVPDADLLAYCDEIRIQRVTESLLTNAIKFSPRGTAITLSARHEAGLVRVWVDDAGPGVRITEQPKIFKRLVRTEAEALEKYNQGSLELVACRRIVQAHHGLITMHNLDPLGAHFEFCLPAMAARRTMATAA